MNSYDKRKVPSVFSIYMQGIKQDSSDAEGAACLGHPAVEGAQSCPVRDCDRQMESVAPA